jgi:hypothetical protein
MRPLRPGKKTPLSADLCKELAEQLPESRETTEISKNGRPISPMKMHARCQRIEVVENANGNKQAANTYK